MSMSESHKKKISEAMKNTDPDIKKGAETTLALILNMLFIAPNVRERELSTRAK